MSALPLDNALHIFMLMAVIYIAIILFAGAIDMRKYLAKK